MTPWVRRIIVANVVMFILSQATPLIYALFQFIPILTLQRPWTLMTYMFLHAPGFMHIFFNMLMLFFFGPRLEAQLGGKKFLILYFVAGITGALLSFGTPFARIIGASGAVFGVLLGYAHFWPKHQIFIWGLFPIQARWMVIGLTVLALWSGLGRTQDGIAHFAHLGGFLGAFLYLKWLDYNAPSKQFKRRVYANVPKGLAQETVAAKRWKTIRRDELHEVNRDEVDRLLAKIEQSGVASLTLDEKAFLDRFV